MKLFFELCVVGVWLFTDSVNAKTIVHPRALATGPYPAELPYSKYGGPPVEIRFQTDLTKPVPAVPPLLHGPPKDEVGNLPSIPTSKPLAEDYHKIIVEPMVSNELWIDIEEKEKESSDGPYQQKIPQNPDLASTVTQAFFLPTLAPGLPNPPSKIEVTFEGLSHNKEDVHEIGQYTPELPSSSYSGLPGQNTLETMKTSLFLPSLPLEIPSLPENLTKQEFSTITNKPEVQQLSEIKSQPPKTLKNPKIQGGPYPAELTHSTYGGPPVVELKPVLTILEAPESQHSQILEEDKTTIFSPTLPLTLPDLPERPKLPSQNLPAASQSSALYPPELLHSTYGGSSVAKEQEPGVPPLDTLSVSREPERPVLFLPTIPHTPSTFAESQPLPEEHNSQVLILPPKPANIPLNADIHPHIDGFKSPETSTDSNRPVLFLQTLPPSLPALPEKPQKEAQELPAGLEEKPIITLYPAELPQSSYGGPPVIEPSEAHSQGPEKSTTSMHPKRPVFFLPTLPPSLPILPEKPQQETQPLPAGLEKKPIITLYPSELPQSTYGGHPVIKPSEAHSQPQGSTTSADLNKPVLFLPTLPPSLPVLHEKPELVAQPVQSKVPEKPIITLYPAELPQNTYGGHPVVEPSEAHSQPEGSTTSTDSNKPGLFLPTLPPSLPVLPEKPELVAQPVQSEVPEKPFITLYPAELPQSTYGGHPVVEPSEAHSQPEGSTTSTDSNKPGLFLPTLPPSLPVLPEKPQLVAQPVQSEVPEKPIITLYPAELPQNTYGGLPVIKPSEAPSQPDVFESPEKAVISIDSNKPVLLLPILPPTLSSIPPKPLQELPTISKNNIKLETPKGPYAYQPPNPEKPDHPPALLTPFLPDKLELPSLKPHGNFNVPESHSSSSPASSQTLIGGPYPAEFLQSTYGGPPVKTAIPDLPMETVKPSIPQPDIIFEPDLTQKRTRSTGVLSIDPRKREVEPFLINFQEPVTSYGKRIYSKVKQTHGLEDVKPQYIPLTYIAQGLPYNSIEDFKEQPIKLPPGVLTKEMIGPYPVEVANHFYGVTMMNPMMMFSTITEPSS